MKNLHALLLLVFLPFFGNAQNGKFDVRLSYGEYTCNPEKIMVLVEVKASAANTSFDMGDATLRFDYKLSEVINPTLKTQHNFSSAATPRDFNYQSQSISKAEAGNDGVLTLNIAYVGLNDGAKTVAADWVSVATLEFDLRSANKCVELKWHDNTRTPITGMSEIITPGSQPVAQAMTGTEFLDMNYCVTDALPTATLSASSNSINEGESTTLTLDIVNARGNWSAILSDGSTVTNSDKLSETFTVSPTATTTYSITNLTDICAGNYGGDNSPSTTVEVINVDPCQGSSLPTASITASATSVIQGQSSTLEVTLTGGIGNWSATLSDGTEITNSSVLSQSIVVFPSTTTTYSITSLSDACGTNAFPVNAPSVTIGVLPDEDPCQGNTLPTASITASATSVIQGQSSTLEVTLTGGIGNWSATLSDGTEITNSSVLSQSIVVFPSTSITYSITSLSDACGTNAFPINAPSVTIGVLPDEDPCQGNTLPTATITASATSVIQGQSSTLEVTLTGGIGNWSATLSDGTEITNSSVSSQSVVVFPSTTTTYSITSLSDACGTNAFPVNAPSVTIGVLPDEDPCQGNTLPTATITASATSVIQGQSSTLEVTLTGGIGNWSATLSDGTEITNSSVSSQSIVVFPSTSITYSITLLSDACGTNAFPVNAPSVTIGVLPDEDPCQGNTLPTASITASATSVIQGQSSTLEVTLTGGIGNWSATLSDGTEITNSSVSSQSIVVFPSTTTTYSITSLSDACGTSAFPINAPSVTIGVLPDGNCVPKPCLPISFKIIKR